MKELKLLLHVPFYASFEPALKMAKNFFKSLQEEEKGIVRILVNFEGVLVLNHFENFRELLREILEKGGKIYFCEKALETFNIPLEKVPPQASTVPSGIRALVEWQEEGFNYVRT
ncbi:MAG: DsrE family protein [Thermodesulfobacteriaceae bacterium]|nr:DsrE family protein [Thermodesulfobacteriaceae bacterium]MCX8041471.1 DsrE family protein [Thermodesulfobacteriaceae bacterium]MDW8135941.1 DsrE family protein [Thermodesulfobacterium sp.]